MWEKFALDKQGSCSASQEGVRSVIMKSVGNMGADLGWCPVRSSKPLGCRTAVPGGFDSHALPPFRHG